MTRQLVSAALLLATVASSPAGAQSAPAVAAAKAAGQVGERFDGYIGYVAAAPGAVRRQVDSVNIRRRALYIDLAARRGVSPQEVGITAGCETLSRVRVGEFYLLGDNAWRRRAAGQAAPVPDYCAP